MEILKLLSDEKFISEIIPINSVEEIYEICTKYGYSGTVEDLKKEIPNLLSSLQDEELETISGGKRNLAKNMAGLAVATINLFSTVSPNLQAEKLEQKKETELKPYLNSVDKKTLAKVGLGGLGVVTLGTLLVGGFRHLMKKCNEYVVSKVDWDISTTEMTDYQKLMMRFMKESIRERNMKANSHKAKVDTRWDENTRGDGSIYITIFEEDMVLLPYFCSWLASRYERDVNVLVTIRRPYPQKSRDLDYLPGSRMNVSREYIGTVCPAVAPHQCIEHCTVCYMPSSNKLCFWEANNEKLNTRLGLKNDNMFFGYNKHEWP